MEAMVSTNSQLHQVLKAISRKAFALALPSAVFLVAQSPAFAGDIDRWQNYQKIGEEAFDNHRWGRAEHAFAKAVREADRTDVGDQKLALSLRKLGEANTAAHKYKEAETNLQRAIKVSKDCGVEDRDAIRDLLELAKTYRSVNLEQFGKNVATVLKETGLDGIEILNTKDGNSRVVVKFADKFNKHINSADVNEINVEKKLTFDIHEGKDGTITLTNIKGLRIRSKMWVNLTQSSIDPNGEEGKTTALVTAEKLGLSKTMSTVLPKPVYDKIFTIVERIRHPELHSPWHKQLQEKIGLSTKPKTVPIKVTDTTKEALPSVEPSLAVTGKELKEQDATSKDALGKDPSSKDGAGTTSSKDETSVSQFASGTRLQDTTSTSTSTSTKAESTKGDTNSVKN